MAEKRKNFVKPPEKPDEEEMEFYNGRYFVINKIMLTLMGLWPYQNKLEKIFIRMTITILITVALVPQFICAVAMKRKGNLGMLINAIGTSIYLIGVGSKFVGMVFTESKLKFLYKNIVQNWKMLETEAERHILEKSSEAGRLLTIGYIGYMIQAGIAFITLPAAHRMFNIIWPLANESRTPIYVLDGEYLVDKEQYYYYIYLYEVFTVFATVPLFSAIDSTYAVCIEQCVGLFNVVKLRLQLATKQKRRFKSCVEPMNDASHEAIARSVELHEKVLNFANILESSYSTSLLFVMICNVMVLATSSANILFNLKNKLLLSRYVMVIGGFTIHMFYLSWPGQKMIDGSNDIFYASYNNEWYDCPIESRKLLKFIMRRTLQPFYLTAGGLYIMNLENFLALFKSSVSYITVLASFNT